MSYESNIKKANLYKFLISFTLFSGVLIPFFLDWGKISFTEVMILQSWFMLWIFILEIPTGVIADKIGRKNTLILAGLSFSLATIIYPSIPSLYIFLIAEFLFAVGVSLVSGSLNAIIYDSLKEIGKEKNSKKVFLRLSTFSRIALLVSAPIGSIIAKTLGSRMPFFLTTIPFALSFIIALTMKEPKIFTHKEKTT